jgi:hypothetical protein
MCSPLLNADATHPRAAVPAQEGAIAAGVDCLFPVKCHETQLGACRGITHPRDGEAGGVVDCRHLAISPAPLPAQALHGVACTLHAATPRAPTHRSGKANSYHDPSHLSAPCDGCANAAERFQDDDVGRRRR